MSFKRIIGSICVIDNLAVQSIGYERYLPIGRPEILAENLDRWGVDEIIIQCIDRHLVDNCPNFKLIEKIASMGLGTPIVYAGGIRNSEHAVKAIQSGADRISIETLLYENPSEIKNISNLIGAQAIVASITLGYDLDKIYRYDYQTKTKTNIPHSLFGLIQDKLISEVLINDWQHEGIFHSFDMNLLKFIEHLDINFILFGGISHPDQVNRLLEIPKVSAVAIGNFLNYKELSVKKLKQQINSVPIRTPFKKKNGK